MKVKLKDKIFTYRFATEKDIDIINKFDINIYRQVNHDFYFRHTKEILKNMISKDRKIMLVFFDKQLVAWAGIKIKAEPFYAKIYNFTEKQLSKSSVLIATAVSPKFRGYGIQKFLIKKRIEYLKKKGKKYFLHSAHPENKYSINNMLESGSKFIKKDKSINDGRIVNYYLLKI
ncbi:MAG TPA: GNAT family N-acetyltransferase [archaeon]|nr:GNAT family N-acetyltransferase [archaeon]